MFNPSPTYCISPLNQNPCSGKRNKEFGGRKWGWESRVLCFLPNMDTIWVYPKMGTCRNQRKVHCMASSQSTRLVYLCSQNDQITSFSALIKSECQQREFRTLLKTLMHFHLSLLLLTTENLLRTSFFSLDEKKKFASD